MPHPHHQPASACCAHEGCTGAGEFRAPKDRSLSGYLMLCLEHVRAYNAKWNFHAGLTVQEMEAEIRSAATWDRPTWKLGSQSATPRGTFRHGRVNVDDPFGFAEGTDFDARAQQKRREKSHENAQDANPHAAPPAARTKAMKILDLSAPLTLEGLKRRYKVLVKQHHPDANGGSVEAEARMKVINEAYQTLRAGLVAESAP